MIMVTGNHGYKEIKWFIHTSKLHQLFLTTAIYKCTYKYYICLHGCAQAVQTM